MKNRHPQLNRRQFLVGASATAWLAATHSSAVLSAGVPPSQALVDPTRAPRLQSLLLRTSAELLDMKRFYGDLLGLEIVDELADRFTVRAGATPVTFVTTGPGTEEAPFYHFAFNIPENKILAAREWQLRRTALIPPYSNLRDPRFPDDVVHFANWNAHSVFFWDPAGNLLEYIARHDLQSAASGPFGSDDILYASEIGLVADDVLEMAMSLEGTFGLQRYGRGSEQFTAIGDEMGLLLVMKRGRILGFDEGRPAGVFPTEAVLRSADPGQVSPAGFPYRVSSG